MLRKLFVIAFFGLLGLLGFVLQRYGNPIILPESNVPVPFQGKTVSAVFVTYRFSSTIKALETNPQALALTLDAPDEELPVFMLDKAKIYKVEEGKQVQASISDLSVSQRVVVETFYDVRTKTWTTVAVYITPPDQGTAQ